MIRKFETQDLGTVMQIWLHGNLDAHPFIPASFWTDHFETVRDMLPQAELYVHENEATRQIDGFIGLTENHIEGIFVAKAARSKGPIAAPAQPLDTVRTAGCCEQEKRRFRRHPFMQSRTNRAWT